MILLLFSLYHEENHFMILALHWEFTSKLTFLTMFILNYEGSHLMIISNPRILQASLHILTTLSLYTEYAD